jgi:MYXO-CTERM domain-containing protein
MNSLRRISTIGAFVLALGAHGQTWDLEGNWAPPANPNGAWQYGEVDGGVFTPLAWTGVSYGVPTVGNAFVYQNGQSYTNYGVLPGDISLEADGGNAAAQWTAPVSGKYAFTIAVGGTLLYTGNGYGNAFAADSTVTVNGAAVGSSSFTNNVMSWSFTQTLSAGSTVDAYVVNPGYPGAGNTDTHFTVNAVPEPAPFAALAVGGLVFLRRRRGIQER